MSNQLKNPIFWSVLLFFLGMGVGVLGWIKNESTNAEFAKGSGFTIGVGIGMIVLGLLGMRAFGSNKRKQN